MPFTTMSTVQPLSNFWTHERILSEAMVLTNTIDNENIQLENIRYHINSSISYLWEMLKLVNQSWYGIWLNGTFENALHATGLEWIDLKVAIGSFTPATQLAEIQRINVVGSRGTTAYTGNVPKYDVSQLTQLMSNQNVQWRHSLGWTHIGSDLVFFVGSEIKTALSNLLAIGYDISNQTITVIGLRKPLLDNMYAPNSVDVNNNYKTNIDLPDEYADLLIKMVMQKILTQIREQVPAQLEQEINQGLMNIHQLLDKDLQFEQLSREKKKYGSQQKSPGEV